jgi:hypothetical protein
MNHEVSMQSIYQRFYKYFEDTLLYRTDICLSLQVDLVEFYSDNKFSGETYSFLSWENTLLLEPDSKLYIKQFEAFASESIIFKLADIEAVPNSSFINDYQLDDYCKQQDDSKVFLLFQKPLIYDMGVEFSFYGLTKNSKYIYCDVFFSFEKNKFTTVNWTNILYKFNESKTLHSLLVKIMENKGEDLYDCINYN